MQLPTHILVGALIQKNCQEQLPPRLALGVSAACAFLSHGLLDKLANLTYHLANPDFHSPIWVGYHLALVLVTVGLLVWLWKPFKWGIFFACVPDVDWVFIHAQEILHCQFGFYRQPYLHHLVGNLINSLPGLAWLNRLPNYRHNPWAILPEVVLLLALTSLLWFRIRRPEASAAQAGEAGA